MNNLEEVLLNSIDAMEEEGIDFREEVGKIEIVLPTRKDLHIEIYVVDKVVHEEFNKYGNVYDDQ